MVKEIRTWTASTMEAGTKELESLACSLQDQSATLMEITNKIKLTIKDTLNQNRKNARVETAVREKAIRPFLNAGTPGVLAKWLFTVGAIKPLEEQGNQSSEWSENDHGHRWGGIRRAGPCSLVTEQ